MFFVRKKRRLVVSHLLWLCTSFCRAMKDGTSRLTFHGQWRGKANAPRLAARQADAPSGMARQHLDAFSGKTWPSSSLEPLCRYIVDAAVPGLMQFKWIWT
jgi:hypothetical protein